MRRRELLELAFRRTFGARVSVLHPERITADLRHRVVAGTGRHSWRRGPVAPEQRCSPTADLGAADSYGSARGPLDTSLNIPQGLVGPERATTLVRRSSANPGAAQIALIEDAVHGATGS